MAKVEINYECNLKLDHDEVKAFVKLIGNSSQNQRMKEFYLSKEESDFISNIYDAIIEKIDKGGS